MFYRSVRGRMSAITYESRRSVDAKHTQRKQQLCVETGARKTMLCVPWLAVTPVKITKSTQSRRDIESFKADLSKEINSQESRLKITTHPDQKV